jgi:hypothetical protein
MQKFFLKLKKVLSTTITFTVDRMKLITTLIALTWMVAQVIEAITGIGRPATVFEILTVSMLLNIYLES